jgi:hypothetical protein
MCIRKGGKTLSSIELQESVTSFAGDHKYNDTYNVLVVDTQGAGDRAMIGAADRNESLCKTVEVSFC